MILLITNVIFTVITPLNVHVMGWINDRLTIYIVLCLMDFEFNKIKNKCVAVVHVPMIIKVLVKIKKKSDRR